MSLKFSWLDFVFRVVKMKFTIALCFMLVSFALSEDDIQKEDGVLVLTKKNFQVAISDNKFILVEFYAPWCGHCKALAPEYAKAAAKLEESKSEIKLAKVDATEETNLAEDYHIKGYPTLKFFRNGKPMDYNGGRTTEEIISWLKKKTGPAAKPLTSIQEAKDLIESGPVVIIGFFKDAESDAAKQYLAAANAIDDYPFGITSNDELFSEHKIDSDKVVLFKKFDEGKSIHDGEVVEKEIINFVQLNALPLVTEFNPDSAQKIFGGEIKSHLLLFVSKKKADEFDTHHSTLKSLAPSFRKKVLFVYIDVDEDDHGRILEFFALSKKDAPAVRLIKLEDEMTKYKPKSDGLSEGDIRDFVQDFIDGKLKPHLMSQDLPEDWDKNPVKVLVSSNFDEVVFDKSKDVLVEFYAPWCGHCKQLAPIYDQLAEKLQSNAEVVIAKIDATTNELEHTKIQSFPTLKLYKKGDNKVIDYNGERTLDALTTFIETGGAYEGPAPEVEEEEDEEPSRKDEL